MPKGSGRRRKTVSIEGEVPRLEKRASDWEGYRTAVDLFREAFPGCALHEMNLLAWLLASRGLSLGSAAYLVSTNVYHDKESRLDEFVKANAVWTGGPGGSTSWDDYAEGVRPVQAYPLQTPEPGDLILVHFGTQGKGIGVVHRNGYREVLSKNARLDVVWVNRSEAKQDSFTGHVALIRARSIADEFSACDAYVPTFRRLAALGHGGAIQKRQGHRAIAQSSAPSHR